MDNPIIINPIYYENTIHISDAKPILEPHHFACAIEEGETEMVSTNVKTNNLKHCFRCLLCIFCLSIMCFLFFIFVGGAVLFF